MDTPIYTLLRYPIDDIVVEIMSIASPVYENFNRLGELLKPRSWGRCRGERLEAGTVLDISGGAWRPVVLVAELWLRELGFSANSARPPRRGASHSMQLISTRLQKGVYKYKYGYVQMCMW